MRCKTCGEVMVFGPAGCACTRKAKAERERKEQNRRFRINDLFWAMLSLEERPEDDRKA